MDHPIVIAGFLLFYLGVFTINSEIVIEYLRETNKQTKTYLYYLPVTYFGRTTDVG